MNGWLTLHWSRDAIDQFVKIDELPVETDLNCTRAIIERCLVSGTAPSNFRLRLTEIDDVDSIYRLVQGLADFEKETDAVHVTPQFFNNDGFITPRPLFYCLLLETMKEETMKEEKWCSCGIALCYVGCKVGEGSFLYLEDLFIEKSHRCQGAGSYVMRILGVIALSLNCSKLVWQALDWNTAALTFYKKIGAEIVDGLLTSRFKGKSLQQLREQQMSK